MYQSSLTSQKGNDISFNRFWASEHELLHSNLEVILEISVNATCWYCSLLSVNRLKKNIQEETHNFSNTKIVTLNIGLQNNALKGLYLNNLCKKNNVLVLMWLYLLYQFIKKNDLIKFGICRFIQSPSTQNNTINYENLLICMVDRNDVQLQTSSFFGSKIHKFFKNVRCSDVSVEEWVGESTLLSDDLKNFLKCAYIFWPFILLKNNEIWSYISQNLKEYLMLLKYAALWYLQRKLTNL